MEEGQDSSRTDDRRKGKAPMPYLPLSKAEQNFPLTGKYSFSNFCKRGYLKDVVSERVFDEELLKNINFEFMDLLKNWGWWDFIVNPNYKTRVEMVKAFYWNGRVMSADEDAGEVGENEDIFSTSVCGVNFNVSVNDVRKFLGQDVVRRNEVLPPRNHDVTEDFLAVHNFPNGVAHMSMHKRILFMIVSQVLMARNDCLHEPSGEDLWWMGKIIREDPPDFCTAIFHRIRNCLKNAHYNIEECMYLNDVCLPYGKLVTRIIKRKLAYNINPSEPLSKGSLDEDEPFDAKAFSHMCSRYNLFSPYPPPPPSSP